MSDVTINITTEWMKERERREKLESALRMVIASWHDDPGSNEFQVALYKADRVLRGLPERK